MPTCICSKNVKNSNIVTLCHTERIWITKSNCNAWKRTVGETKQCVSLPSGLLEWTSIDQLIQIRSTSSLMFRQTEHHIFLHCRTLYFCLLRIKVLKEIAASRDFLGGLAAFVFIASWRLAAIFTAGLHKSRLAWPAKSVAYGSIQKYGQIKQNLVCMNIAKRLL